MYIVITNKGFLTTKEEPEPTDKVIHEANNEECEDIIHGKGKRNKTHNEKFNN
jgi:hypothetical protein